MTHDTVYITTFIIIFLLISSIDIIKNCYKENINIIRLL